MESNISHNIADLFTSRPKAYSISMINKLMEIRMLYKNNYNLKALYLNNYNCNTVLNINEKNINYSIFEPLDTPKTYSLPFNLKDPLTL